MVQVMQCVMSQHVCTSSVHSTLPGHYLHTRQLQIVCAVAAGMPQALQWRR